MKTITDRGELVDVLRAFLRGRYMIVINDMSGRAVIDGAVVHHSLRVLLKHYLVEPVHIVDAMPNVVYLRLSADGIDFARRAVHEWRQKSFLERRAIRCFG